MAVKRRVIDENFTPQNIFDDIWNAGAGVVGAANAAVGAITGAVYSGVSAVSGAVAGAGNAATAAASGAVSAVVSGEQAVVGTISGALSEVDRQTAAAIRVAQEVNNAGIAQATQMQNQASQVLAQIAANPGNVEAGLQQAIAAGDTAAANIYAYAQIANILNTPQVKQAEADVKSSLNDALAALSRGVPVATQVVSSAVVPLAADAVPIVPLLAATENLVSDSPSVGAPSIGDQISKEVGDVSNTLQSVGKDISKMAENIPGQVTDLTPVGMKALGVLANPLGEAAPAVLGAISSGANYYSVGGVPLGDMAAKNVENTAVVLASGVVATPGTLWDIGWNLGTEGAAIVKGESIGNLKKSNLGEQSQNAFLGSVKSLTGFEANKELLTQEAASLAEPSLKSGNLFLQVGGVGIMAIGGVTDYALNNPVLFMTGEGQVLQIASQIPDIFGAFGVKGFNKPVNSTEFTGNKTAVVSEKAVVAPSQKNKPGAKIKYVPTTKTGCVGHVVGSAESKAAGCG